MQGIKRKVVYITLYEIFAIAMSTTGLALLSGAEMGHASVAAPAAAIITVRSGRPQGCLQSGAMGRS